MKRIFYVIMFCFAMVYAADYSFDLMKIHKRAFENADKNPFTAVYYGAENNRTFHVDTIKEGRGVIDSIVVFYKNKDASFRWVWNYNFSQSYLRYKSTILYITKDNSAEGDPKYRMSVIYEFDNGGFLKDSWPGKGDLLTKDKVNEPWKLYVNTQKGFYYQYDEENGKIYSSCYLTKLDSVGIAFGFPKNTFRGMKKENISSYSDRDSIRHVMGYFRSIDDSTFASIEMNGCNVRMMAIYRAQSAAINASKKYLRVYENRGRDSYLCDTLGCFNLDWDGNIVEGPKTRARRMKSYGEKISSFCKEDYITGLVKRAGLPDTLFYNSDSVYTYRANGSSNRYLTRLVKKLDDQNFAEVIYNDISNDPCKPYFVNTYYWENGKKRILTSNGTDIANFDGIWGASYCYGKKCVSLSNKNPYEIVEKDESKPVKSNRECPFDKTIASFEKKMHANKFFKKKTTESRSFVNDDETGDIEYLTRTSPETSDGYVYRYTYSFYDNCDIMSVNMKKLDAETEEPVEEKIATMRNDETNTLHFVCDENGKKYDEKCSCFDKKGKFFKKAHINLDCMDPEELELLRGVHYY